MIKKIKTMSLVLISVIVISGCGGGDNSVDTINGAGASFPFPIYSELFQKYNQETQIKVNYQSIGSGGGIRQIVEETVDFGATDAFIDDEQLAEINSNKKNQMLHIPTVLGGVAAAYNLEEEVDLKLDGNTLAKIFMGEITKWNDNEIKNLNPNVNLPNANIIVVRRSDGSGTTFTFSDFLANQSSEWRETTGVGKSLNWFKGSIGAKGNEGVTGAIVQNKNSIGYVNLNYAMEARLKTMAVKNNAGNFIIPTIESVSLAAQTSLPEDTRIKLTSLKSSSPNAYPISTFTWIIFYQEQSYNDRPKELAVELKKLLTWMVGTQVEEDVTRLEYSPLPESAREKALKIIDSITFEGEKL